MEKEGAGLGKRVGGALYVHRSALDHLPPEHAALIDAAACRVPHRNWNVAKVDFANGGGVSLLSYDDFADSAFPVLNESYRVDLKTGAVTVRCYGKNPPILHRKELLLPPNAPERDIYVALTRELERRGLFVEMTKRGRQDAWNAALTEARIEVRDHLVVARDDPASKVTKLDISNVPSFNAMPQVVRHRTAIGRNSLSAPMAALNAAGLLKSGVSILDYGCGRGDDVRALRAAGIDAVGWDPHFAPERSALVPRAIVNLGFVLNVVENPLERRDVLRRAFALAERCLAVAVMLVGKGEVSGQRPHGDGFLTSRGTFQRYYTQAELRAFLLDTLEVTPVAAGPGIFFIFRDEELEQRVLSRRQTGMIGARPIPSVPRQPSSIMPGTSWRQETLEAVRDDLVNLFLRIGRVPHADEIPKDLRSQLASARLSVKMALADAFAAIPAENLAIAAARRADEIGRFFALSSFSGRAPYRRLSPTLQRDLRAIFGSLTAAEAVARRMLFDAGDGAALAEDAHSHAAAGIGQLAGDKYQVHARDLPKLTPRLRTYISVAQALAGSLDNTTIYRVHLASRKLTALVYPDFDTSALPRLSERTKVDLCTGEVIVFDHQADGRVSVMMEKSLYMAGDEKRYRDQAKFELDLRSLFGDRLSTLTFAEAAPMIMKAGLKLPY
ncbi:DNA phosphorothioation-associated putative methyltransferase [Falsirhodobacter algicola]|uniref:DNA phosphorothioation-associated putative methyltransferase n=1 Tax=Falsirhodobacter algicola TaxID=2692330 RepID=A0A8J8MVA4_9RHOB|nr:DNA phosphorothioation-associated putative methyltransferase [Falsirhodobacter algicola]QUS37102.1 DNA phosphorothioation-associated putative methyltransferase [Falsirhodobacter algicola]